MTRTEWRESLKCSVRNLLLLSEEIFSPALHYFASQWQLILPFAMSNVL